MRVAVVTVVGLLLGVVPSGQKSKTTRFEKKPLIITAFTSTTNTISYCPFSRMMCDPSLRVILNTQVQNSQKRGLTYFYSVSSGTVDGSGPAVTWDLNGALIGHHTATVSVRDARGQIASATLEVKIVECSICHPPPPPCPVVTVSCPSEIEKGKPITFTANIKGDSLLGDASYEWWISSGKIVKGQFEKIMSLEPSGFPFETITATVSVRGFDPSCTGTQASCTISIKDAPR